MRLHEGLRTGQPDATALVYNDESVTFDVFRSEIDAGADVLRESGVGPGDRVILDLADRRRFLAYCYATSTVGASFVPLINESDERLIDAAGIVGATAVVNEAGLSLIEVTSNSTPPSSREAMVIFTSGTTGGRRKGVLLAHEGVDGTARFMNEAMAVDNSIREVVFGAMDHAFVFGRCHAVLSAGGTVLLGTKALRIDSLFRGFVDHGANALSTAPSTIAGLLRSAFDKVAELDGRLELIQTGAMRFDESLRATLCDALPNARIYAHYGLSEAMRTTFFELQSNRDKLHTEGPASAGVELQIRDEDGAPVENGQIGTIAIRGRNLCLGYTDEAAWSERSDGEWFVTSDAGSLDQDGYLVFAGRSDDAINANGLLVHPDEIEQRLVPHLKMPICVLGIPDPAGVRDSVVALCVEGSIDGVPSVGEVRGLMSDAPDHHVPKTVMAVDEFPRTRTGKISRVALRELLLSS